LSAGTGRASARGSDEVDGSDVVINLTGRSVNCRYTPANRREILESRVLSTRAVGQAIAQAARPPRVWLQASTATIYAHRFDGANDERSGVLAEGIERAQLVAIQHRRGAGVGGRIRRGASHTHAKGGAAIGDDAQSGSRRRVRHAGRPGAPRLGGSAGDGRQFISWIHYEDFVAAIRWLIEHDEVDGVVNVAAPDPLPNAPFMRRLREAAGVSIGLPANRWMLEVGAVFMRTETS